MCAARGRSSHVDPVPAPPHEAQNGKYDEFDRRPDSASYVEHNTKCAHEKEWPKEWERHWGVLSLTKLSMEHSSGTKHRRGFVSKLTPLEVVEVEGVLVVDTRSRNFRYRRCRALVLAGDGRRSGGAEDGRNCGGCGERQRLVYGLSLGRCRRKSSGLSRSQGCGGRGNGCSVHLTCLIERAKLCHDGRQVGKQL